MTRAAVRTSQDKGLERTLGIRIVSSAKDRVSAEMALRRQHLLDDGAVQGFVVAALADYVTRAGAGRLCPAGRRVQTVEAKTNFFAAGEGEVLHAEAVPVHAAGAISVWRTRVLRGAGEAVAEVTQTLLYAETAAAQSARPEKAATGTVVPLVRALPDEVLPGAKSETRTRRGAVIDERRQQIFEGACKVIAEKGFAKATIREIAAAAGLPVPTMYLYLKRKEDLLYGIYEYFMRDLVAALEQSGTAGAHPVKRLEDAIRTMIDEFDRNQQYIKLMFQETRSLTPEAREKVYELDSRYIGILRGLLDEVAAAQGLGIRNTELAANYIYFLCGIWVLRYWTIGKFGKRAATRGILDFVLGGIGAKAEAA